ncbi:Casein kinase I 2 [Brettanomyces nanus]|uniref:non-specific serine/threonine protein kinase n=1 Tax=Eeniella nana TaxID=13502 RepID=A0A875S4V7_EENNA|nr:Casein kinase I 2 [Brettanomyces nanus]QPG75953.1 Casein kinase I 2 [Brettanomyces nanus]
MDKSNSKPIQSPPAPRSPLLMPTAERTRSAPQPPSNRAQALGQAIQESPQQLQQYQPQLQQSQSQSQSQSQAESQPPQAQAQDQGQSQPEQSDSSRRHHRHRHGQSGSSSSSRNIIAGHYQIAQKIGEGSFGIIFKGYDLLRDNQPVAIKFESRKSEAPQLRDEFKAYKILSNAVNNYTKSGADIDPGHTKYLSLLGMPKVYYFGQEGYYNILIIQLLGPSLEDLFEWCGRRFSIKTVAQCAKQMIARIQFVHENNLIYRDIKPDNFLVGATSDDNTIYLVDFGMIKQYRNPITKQHIPYRERKSLSGTARYMSINTHLGREQSRRDDLESLGHVFIYFLKGELPWQGLKAPTNKLKYEKIGEKKQATSIQQLCGRLPSQFGEYMAYVRSLKFEEQPDYRYLVSLMDLALASVGETDDGIYDWMKLNDGRGWDWAKNKKINLNGYGSNNRNKQHRSTRAIPPNHSQLQNSLSRDNSKSASKYNPDVYGKINENTALLTGQLHYDSYVNSYSRQQQDQDNKDNAEGFGDLIIT